MQALGISQKIPPISITAADYAEKVSGLAPAWAAFHDLPARALTEHGRPATPERDGPLRDATLDVVHVLASWAYTKRMWVYRKLASKDLLLSSRPAKEFVTGEGFSYLGRSHWLLISSSTDSVRMERGRGPRGSRPRPAQSDPGA